MKNRQVGWGLLVVLLIGQVLTGCETRAGRGIEKDGTLYGVTKGTFRHRWWNYYERGVSFAEGQFYQEALADFQQSLKDREKDQRMARTYGMHFIDYFPHRERGVIYYLTGNPEDAKKELEISISQFPTAKARFYLDRVRKAILEKTISDAGAPSLTLKPDAEEIWTRDDPVMVSGAAEDDRFVSAVFINKKPLFMEGSETRRAFEKALALSQGTHIIEVEAKNLLGGAVKRRIIIHVDREGPLITVEDIRQQGEIIRLLATIYDESGVADILLNNRKLSVHPDFEIALDESFPLTRDPVELSATDRLGNTTFAAISVLSSPDHSVSRLSASLSSDMNRYNAGSTKSLPQIQLKDWTDHQTVYLEKIYISGEVSDDVNIESLTVNQTPVLRKKGRRIFFNTLTELDPGPNTIIIEAKNESGITSKQEITVIREIPQALKLSERLTVSVLPFELNGDAVQASLAYQDNLIAALMDRDRFQVVDRSKLDAVLQEQKLSRTDLIDAKTAVRTGKLVAAQSIITGTIHVTRTGIEIVAKMIDTETSVILAAKDVYDEEKDIPALKLLAQGMSIQFVQEFPLAVGIVLQLEGKDVLTDLGEGKIALKRRLIVYREKPVIHPVTGKLIGSNNVILGKAMISQVMPEMSKAEVIQGNPEDFLQSDKVITQ